MIQTRNAKIFFAGFIFALLLGVMSVAASETTSLQANNRNVYSQEFLVSTVEMLLASTMQQDVLRGNAVLEGFDFNGTLELGSKLSAYRYQYFLEEILDIHWYPVLVNGRVEAIVSVHGDSAMPNVSLRTEFAHVLQDFIDENGSSVALLFEGDNLYAVAEDAKTVLWTYPGRTAENTESASRSIGVEMRFASVAAVLELSAAAAQEEYMVNSVMPFNAPNSRRLDVPVVMQPGGTNLCWAASAASVGRFVTNRGAAGNAPRDVARTVGVSDMAGANATTTANALRTHFMVLGAIAINGRATMPVIVQQIGAEGKPVIGYFFASTGGMGHVVVLNGYVSSSQGMALTYMDPNVGFITISIFSDNFSINVGGTQYWNTFHVRV